jgi:hypothetical protein
MLINSTERNGYYMLHDIDQCSLNAGACVNIKKASQKVPLNNSWMLLRNSADNYVVIVFIFRCTQRFFTWGFRLSLSVLFDDTLLESIYSGRGEIQPIT